MAQHVPVATAELSRRLDAVSAACLAQRYDGPGNPMGTQWLRAGTLVAHKVPHVPENAFMNAAHGLVAPDQVDTVLAFFGATGQSCWIGVSPHTPTAVTDRLAAEGFRPVSYSAVLYGTPGIRTHPEGVEVTAVGDGELDLFLDTLNRGFDVPAEHMDAIRANQQFWGDVENWSLLLARLEDEDEPVGAAVLAVTDGCGYLAAASTLADQRRHGVHAALVAHRIALANELGCSLVSAEAGAGSVSQCNLQRGGLEIAHTKTVWSNAAA